MRKERVVEGGGADLVHNNFEHISLLQTEAAGETSVLATQLYYWQTA